MAFSFTGFLKGLLIQNEVDRTKQVIIQSSASSTTNTSTTITTAQTANRTLTLPDATDTLAGIAATQTLTNKTLNSTDVATGIQMASFTPDGTHTLTAPSVTDTLVGLAATQTLTNKSMDGGSNTFTNIPQSSIAGPVSIANGGTGQTTQQAAINALAGAVTSGDFLRGNGTNILVAPIQVADVPTLNQNTTGTAANITATSNSTLTTLSSLSLPGSQVTGSVPSATSATTATNIAGGADGSIPYQTAAGATAFLAAGLAGTVLTTQGGASAPTWTSPLVNPMTTWQTLYGAAGGTLTALNNGAAGTVLTSSGTSSAPTWSAPSSFGMELYNLGIAASVAGNALTIALKQADGATDPSTGGAAVKAGLRNPNAATAGYNERTISAPLSLTISSGTTLGLVSAVTSNIWFYLIDSDGAGTMVLGASKVLYDESSLQSTVIESVSATATNASPCVFTTSTSSGFVNGDAVQITGTPPTGFTAGTTYYTTVTGTNTYNLSATPNGTAINSTSTGSSIVLHSAGSRLASTGAYSGKPIRVIGYGVFSEGTAGVWASSPNSMEAGILGTKAIPGIYASYYDSSGQSIPASTTTVVNFNTKESDNTSSALTGSAWKFIAPVAGTYEISANVAWANQAWANTNATSMTLYKNNASYLQMSQTPIWVTETVSANSMHGILNITLAQNDYVDVRVFQNNSSARTLLANGSAINVTRIGD
jgi:hypothetical protein